MYVQGLIQVLYLYLTLLYYQLCTLHAAPHTDQHNSGPFEANPPPPPTHHIRISLTVK